MLNSLNLILEWTPKICTKDNDLAKMVSSKLVTWEEEEKMDAIMWRFSSNLFNLKI